MSISTNEEAKGAISGWLNENGHDLSEIEDDKASFHFEIDYPLGSTKKQRVLQPKEYPSLVVLLNGVAIADEHKEKIKELTEDEQFDFYNEVRTDLLFVENSFEMDTDEENVVQQIQFSYEFYFDTLGKTQLFKGLLLNHRTLLYIVTKFNKRFGVPDMPEDAAPQVQ